MIKTTAFAAAAFAAVCLAAGCGGSSTGPSSGGGGNTGGGGTTNTTTITLTSSGASPRDITVAVGSRVTFVNNDSQPHDMDSNPHPEHTDCPELNQIGFLNPGQSRQSGNLNTVRTCGFHDHDDFSNTRLIGRIIIQ